jgi:hypothetical protein
MVRKTSPNKRGRELMYYAPNRKPLSPDVTKEIFQDASPEVLKMHRSKMALAALSLEPMKEFLFADGKGGFRKEPVPSDFRDPFREAMLRAFKHFNLDPDDPFSWRVLVQYFAYVFFWRNAGKRGGKTKWTEEREAKLLDAIQGLPGLSDIQAARKLVNEKASPFYVKGTLPSDGVRGLRQRIGKVRKKLSTN